MSDSLLAYRDRFPILATSCYLNNNSLGAMPVGVREGLAEYADLWSRRGVRAWNEDWWNLSTRVADLIAPLLGAPPSSVTMQPNVTMATAVFLSCLEATPERRKIVTTDLQFPSVLYIVDSWCRKNDTVLEILPSGDRFGVDPDRLLSAIDTKTLAVAISHAEFKTAFLNEAPAVAQRCRETGALLLLDVFQSVGVLPLQLQKWGVDVASGGCLKWLCGGPGNAFLYVDPELAPRLCPRLTGWMAHCAPFAFEPPPVRQKAGSERFLTGTPQIAALYAARPGLEILTEVGIDAVRKQSLELTEHLLLDAAARGWATATPANREQRGGTVTIAIKNGAEITRELSARNIIVDYRPDAGIRIAPHFYNTLEECSHCLDQIGNIVEDGSWRRHSSVTGVRPT